LIHQPQLVILDEPTTGLDIEARYEIWELIRQLKNQGMTILLTTHLLPSH
jgi:ABC-2 type transport system ATP-binding protein